MIGDELTAIRAQFGDRRWSEIVVSTQDLAIEDFITPLDMVVTPSHTGYIKSQPLADNEQQTVLVARWRTTPKRRAGSSTASTIDAAKLGRRVALPTSCRRAGSPTRRWRCTKSGCRSPSGCATSKAPRTSGTRPPCFACSFGSTGAAACSGYTTTSPTPWRSVGNWPPGQRRLRRLRRPTAGAGSVDRRRARPRAAGAGSRRSSVREARGRCRNGAGTRSVRSDRRWLRLLRRGPGHGSRRTAFRLGET